MFKNKPVQQNCYTKYREPFNNCLQMGGTRITSKPVSTNQFISGSNWQPTMADKAEIMVIGVALADS